MSEPKTYPNYIDGEWVESSRVFQNLSPADTGDCVGIFCKANQADVNVAAQAAQDAFPAWASLPGPRRAARTSSKSRTSWNGTLTRWRAR